jgi:hypothetical protein
MASIITIALVKYQGIIPNITIKSISIIQSDVAEPDDSASFKNLFS